jgi:hypothetical protein
MFAENAIGFYLQVEDQMSPVLKGAWSNYSKYTKAMDALNKKSYGLATQMMDRLGTAADTLVKAPTRAVRAFNKAVRDLSQKTKPLSIKVELKASAARQLGRELSRSVVSALERTKLRLSAVVPTRKSAQFRTDITLKQLYKDEPQPVDYSGTFKPMRISEFAEGGVTGVPGSPGMPPVSLPADFRDKILAWLRPGEVVIPPEWTKDIETAFGKGSKAAEFGSAVTDIQALTVALGHMRKAMEAGMTPPGATETYEEAVACLEDRILSLTDATKGLSEISLAKLSPVLNKTTDSVRALDAAATDMGGAMEDATKKGKSLLESGLRTEQATTFLLAIRNIADSLGTAAGREGVDSFIDNMNKVNATLGLSRGELRGLKGDLANTGAEQKGYMGMTDLGEAVEALADAGGRTREQFQGMGPVVAMVAKQSGLGFGEVAESVFNMTEWLGISTEEAGKLLLAQRRLAKNTLVGIKEIQAASRKFQTDAEGYLALVGPEQSKKALAGVAGFTAAMGEYGVGLRDMLQGLVLERLTGSMEEQIDATNKLNVLFGGTTVQAEDFINAFTEGDMTAIGQQMDALGSKLVQMTDGLPPKEKMASLTAQFGMMGLDVKEAAKGMAWLAQGVGEGPGAVTKRFTDLGKVIEDTDGSLKGIREGAKETTTWITSLKNAASTVFAKFGGAEVMDFLKEFNPMLVLTVAHLAHMTGLFGGIRKMLAGSLGALFGGKGGKGGAAAAAAPLSALGGAAGAGAGGFLQGLGAGLKALANPMALLGIVAVTGAIIGLGYALNLASPAIKEIMTGLTGMVGVFKEMDAGQILATTVALIGMGPALAGIGVGVFSMATSMALALPALALVSKALGVMTVPGLEGGSAIGAFVMQLANAFQVDVPLVQAASARVGASLLFVAGVGAMMATMGAMAGGAMTAGAVGWLIEQTTGKGPFQYLADSAADIAKTVRTMVSGFDVLTRDAMFGTKVKAVSEISGHLFNFVGSLVKISTALVGGMAATSLARILAAPFQPFEFIASLFGRRTNPFQPLIDNGADIKTTVESLIGTFSPGPGGGEPEIITKLKGAIPVITGFAQFAYSFAETATNLARAQAALAGARAGTRGLDPAMMMVVFGPVVGFLAAMFNTKAGEEGPIFTLGKMADEVNEGTKKLIEGYSGIDPAKLTLAVDKVRSVTVFTGDLAKSLLAVQDAAKTFDAMQGAGFFSWLAGGSLSDSFQRAEGAYASLSNTFSAITTFYQPAMESRVNLDVAPLEAALQWIGTFGSVMRALDAMAKATPGYEGLSYLNMIGGALGGAASGVRNLTSNPLMSLLTGGQTAGRITLEPNVDIIGPQVIHPLMAFAAGITGEGSALHKEAKRTNELLAQVVAMLGAPPAATAAPSPASPVWRPPLSLPE